FTSGRSAMSRARTTSAPATSSTASRAAAIRTGRRRSRAGMGQQPEQTPPQAAQSASRGEGKGVGLKRRALTLSASRQAALKPPLRLLRNPISPLQGGDKAGRRLQDAARRE